MSDDHRLLLEATGNERRIELRLEGRRVFDLEWELGPAFGKLQLKPAEADEGDALIEAMAEAFECEAPESPETTAPLRPREVPYTLLSRRGAVVLTKWFLTFDGREGEVFFNVDLESGQAEFLEKDSDVTPDALAALARLLRDGEPSLSDDPRFSKRPPLGNLRPVTFPERVSLQRVFDDRAVFSTSNRLLALELATGAISELFRSEGGFRATWDEPASCWLIVGEGAGRASPPPAQPAVLLDGEPIVLKIPPGFAPRSVSADREWLGLLRWHDCTTRSGRFSEFALWNRLTGAQAVARDGERSFHFVAWHERGVVLDVFDGIESRAKRQVLLDRAGAVEPFTKIEEPPLARLDGDRLVLPSGVAIELTPAERDDHRPSDVTRLSPRLASWRRFGAPVFVELSTGALFVPEEKWSLIRLSPDCRRAVVAKEGRWSIADVLI